jgi:hypothetical protein
MGKQYDSYREPSDVQKIRDLILERERVWDFVNYLFDESEHCDHISLREAWEEFEAWQDKMISDKNPERSIAPEADSGTYDDQQKNQLI